MNVLNIAPSKAPSEPGDAAKRVIELRAKMNDILGQKFLDQHVPKRGLKRDKIVQGKTVVDAINFGHTRESQSARGVFIHGVSQAFGHQAAQGCFSGYMISMRNLVLYLPKVLEALKRDGFEDLEGLDGLYKYLQPLIEVDQLAMQARLDAGVVEFDDLQTIFKPGTPLVTTFKGVEVAGIVHGIAIQFTWLGQRYWKIDLEIAHAMGGKLRRGQYSFNLMDFEGVEKPEKLPARVLSDEAKKRLTDRGQWLASALKDGVAYLAYTGEVMRFSWFGDQSFRADGRVMIDANSFKRIDADGFRETVRGLSIQDLGQQNKYAAPTFAESPDEDERDASADEKGAIAERELADMAWKMFPFAMGFSFRAKKWGAVNLAQVGPIQWASDAYDKLVLDQETKDMVRALVEHSSGSFEDLIEGKGGGCIFLLHGPPGQGKTLTAETIAELLKKPLYSVSVGELGVTPDELEKRLRTILDVACVWDAVILLDEADIYLEERNERDIVRNAMVGVFLRLLEYHQGVLFLTTNRVKNIDKAFYSRVSVGIRFTDADDDKRQKIWENLLDAAGVKGVNAHALAKIDANGRQIKNAIRIAQTLAKAKGEPVTQDLILQTVTRATEFKP